MSKRSHRPSSFFARAGFYLAVLALLTCIVSGSGNRFGFWTFRTGFKVLGWGFYIAVGAIVFSALGLIVTRPHRAKKGSFRSALGLLIGLAIVGTLLNWFWVARHVPPIHDITTDRDNPPRFVALLSIRKNAPNAADYGGPGIGAQQQEAYPDLEPLMSTAPPDQAFRRALSAARDLGWEIADVNPASGRIEATDTTFWFGFKDDIVIRVIPVDRGSRIDIRSVSRVGKSDVGTNAKRIRRFLEKVKAEP